MNKYCNKIFCNKEVIQKLMPFNAFSGDFQQTMNVHMLRHVPKFVRMYGPLFNSSCFGFESMNSYLKSMVHGTRHVNSQVNILEYMLLY